MSNVIPTHESTETLTTEIQAELASDIPAVVEIGKHNPLTTKKLEFPDVSYHAFNWAKGPFEFDEFFDGSRKGVNNDVFGQGLYCADLSLAGKYAVSFGGGGMVAELRPWHAKLIDTTSSEYRQPLERSFIEKFYNYLENHRLGIDPKYAKEIKVLHNYTKDRNDYISSADGTILSKTDGIDSHKMDELVRRFNTVQILGNTLAHPERTTPSLDNLFKKRTSAMSNEDSEIPITIDRDALQSFLMSEGIDGMKMRIIPSVDNKNTYDSVVYWRLDHVGDIKTWENRFRTSKASAALGSTIMRHMISHHGEGIQLGNDALHVLKGEKHISHERAQELKSKIRGTEQLLSSKHSHQLWNELLHKKIDPVEVISFLAVASPEIKELLPAEVGVWEGYRLHEHTQAVLGQFEHYFAPRLSKEPESRAFLGTVRTVLLLQDMGKSLAVASGSGKENQAIYNQVMAQRVLSNMPISMPLRELIIDLVGQDFMGSAIKADSLEGVQTAVNGVTSLANKHGELITKEALMQVLTILYMCDASAYTKSASYIDAETGKRKHCKQSLDYLFEIAPRTARMRLASKQMQIFQAIFSQVNS